MVSGSGIGINGYDNSRITKAKGYTKYFLNSLGYKTPVGKVFLMPRLIKGFDEILSFHVSQNKATIKDIYAYVDTTFGYPCFVKPNRGLKGIGVHKCFNDSDIQGVIRKYEQAGIKDLIVEEFVDLPNYRINTIGNEIICSYLRHTLSVTGNGKSKIRELLLQKQTESTTGGTSSNIKMDDPRIAHNLQRSGFSFETVLPVDKVLTLHDFSNLSAGATAEDCTEKIHPHWEGLSTSIANDFGLRLSGIDFLCTDIEDPDADYSVIEINSSPNLENYALMGEKQTKITRDLYQRILNESNPNYTNIMKTLKERLSPS